MALRACRLSSCGSQALNHKLNSCAAWAQLLKVIWDPPRSGSGLESPALAGRTRSLSHQGSPELVDLKTFNIYLIYSSDYSCWCLKCSSLVLEWLLKLWEVSWHVVMSHIHDKYPWSAVFWKINLFSLMARYSGITMYPMSRISNFSKMGYTYSGK